MDGTVVSGSDGMCLEAGVAIIWSDHAPERVIRRKIDPSWVERTMAAPEEREPDPDHAGRRRAYAAILEAGGRVLRMVYEPMGENLVVVTAFLDRKRTRSSGRGSSS